MTITLVVDFPLVAGPIRDQLIRCIHEKFNEGFRFRLVGKACPHWQRMNPTEKLAMPTLIEWWEYYVGPTDMLQSIDVF